MHIQLANTLFNDGTLITLYRSGFITDRVFLYREIYLWVTAQEHIRNITRSRAVTEAQAKFDRDKRTIWRAIQSFSGTDIVVSPQL